MNWLLPSLVRMKLSPRWPALWVPVFLLWPLWLLTLGFCFGALFVVGISVGRRPVAPALATAFEATRSLHVLACALRGTHCEISAAGSELSFSIV
jgi:hypothetical protein